MPKPCRFLSEPWRSVKKPLGLIIPKQQPASTIWRMYAVPWVTMSRPSRYMSGRWRSGKSHLGPNIPIPLLASTIWLI
jgi:hypothetical protein